MYRSPYCLFILSLLIALCSCTDKRKEKSTITTPWGDELDLSGRIAAADSSHRLTLDEIVRNGELILLTENGPQTYYEYRGMNLGIQYLLVQEFARRLGVRVRVELCKDSAEMANRLANYEGDIIAYTKVGKFKTCDDQLRDSVKKWCTEDLIAELTGKEKDFVENGGVKRVIYSPYLNPGGGVISNYDAYFKQYGQRTGWDWRLIAAQCYQESAFDPQAVSFAGAKGLMQIMPGTAAHLGLSAEEVYDPEKSIAAACKYITELTEAFKDVPDAYERQNFVLASYNGGSFHVRDAMALAEADGRNKYSWTEVKPYILKLATPEGYRNPIVKYGFLRGSETAGYVDAIRRRYEQYGGVNNASGRTYSRPKPEFNNIRTFAPTAMPQRAQ